MTRVLILLLLFVTPAMAQTFSASEIRQVQQALSDADYEPGGVDGKFSGKTATAIRQYQSDWELPETGKISADLIARLAREHEATRPSKIKAENQDCVVDNPHPMARETITFDGDCSSGKLNGQGKIVWRYMHKGQWQESIEESEYLDGKSHGKGVYTWASGDRYEGDWRDDKQHGKGVYTWANGNHYEGDWRDDKMHGKGVYTWANGDRYEGDWRDDKPHGKGVHTKTNGQRYSGTWCKGCWTNGKR
ncbi:MAG: hypothetical protein GY927_13025 [bacterium]|nr:hypothetical protein [bacterium]